MFMLVLYSLHCLLSIFVAQQGKVTGVRSPERPVVPNVTALSATEMRITWCRVNSNKVEINHYELYIDTQLEYSGIDVMYIAKRLKPWSWYEVKLRACGFSPGSCSPFSRLALVKTLGDGDNTTTVIHSGVTIFKVIVVPTYMFILGMIAGVLAISLVFIWRYIQCTDLSGGSAFELPQFVTTADEEMYSNIALASERPPAIGKDPLMSSQVNEAESQYLEIVPSKVEITSQQNQFVFADFLSPNMYAIHSVCDKTKGVPPTDQVAFQMPTGQIETPCITHTQAENLSNGQPLLNNYDTREHEPGLQNGTVKDVIQLYEQNVNLSNSAQTNDARRLIDHSLSVCSVEALEAASKGVDLSQSSSVRCDETSDSQLCFSSQEMSTDLRDHSSSFCQDRLIVAIDNSNIYIGAQECASTVNAGDRKRHVRVKLQNLVRILEKERTKIRGFACGSSPPATEHVWDVYRRLGYIVDLEDRRGKDEQRVDEGLHLWIYKALCELSPGVLVLATGDGMKGKSECHTSFPRCAMTALERGWNVEVCSWKHSLSSEWIKLAGRHSDKLTIHYLDNYVNYITFVDGKNGRKCSPLPSETTVLQR